jgi:hypothetical protein
MLMCPIIVHFLEIDEKLNCLVGQFKLYFSKLPHNNNNKLKFGYIFYKMI